MSRLDDEIRDALRRARADELDQSRTRFRREPEPVIQRYDWGPLGFLKPATPWHLIAAGIFIYLLGRAVFIGTALAGPAVLLGVALAVIGILSLIILPRGAQPKRWRGRLISTDQSWRAELYRWLYRR